MINKEKRSLGRWIVLANIPDKSREEIVNDCKSLQKIRERLAQYRTGKTKGDCTHIYLCSCLVGEAHYRKRNWKIKI